MRYQSPSTPSNSCPIQFHLTLTLFRMTQLSLCSCKAGVLLSITHCTQLRRLHLFQCDLKDFDLALHLPPDLLVLLLHECEGPMDDRASGGLGWLQPKLECVSAGLSQGGFASSARLFRSAASLCAVCR